MLKVIQFRSGAPDKIYKFVSGDYELIQRDGVNLCDYSPEEISSVSDDTYFACCGDEDVIFSKSLSDELKNKIGTRMFLPYGPDGLFKFEDFYPKDSKFYRGLTEATGIQYNLRGSYTIDEFIEKYDEIIPPDKFVIKVQMGSGSRGVYVINSEREPQVGSREQYKTWEPWMKDDVIKWAKKNNSKILLQDLAYTDLSKQVKYNCNAIVRNGRLVLYKINFPDNDSTNYDHAKFIRNEFTDNFIHKIVDYYKSCGITDILIGVDGYTDFKDFTTAIEFNCRYENSFFEFEAFDIDFMDAYLHPENYHFEMIPFGEYPFVRYWRCSMFHLGKGGSLV